MLQSTVLLECVQLKSRFITITLRFSFTDLNRVPQEWVSSDILQFWCGLPILFINTNINKHQQTYKIMGCFDTGKLSESVIRNGSVTPVWVGALLVYLRLCRANMMTVADAKRFVASRRARRSGIAAPLCHIWLPAAPLRQLASSYDHACKSSPALHRMHAWWNPDRVLGKSALFMIFRLEAVPESTVRRYFLQVLVSWIYRFPGSRMPVGSTEHDQGSPTALNFYCD